MENGSLPKWVQPLVNQKLNDFFSKTGIYSNNFFAKDETESSVEITRAISFIPCSFFVVESVCRYLSYLTPRYKNWSCATLTKYSLGYHLNFIVCWSPHENERYYKVLLVVCFSIIYCVYFIKQIEMFYLPKTL